MSLLPRKTDSDRFKKQDAVLEVYESMFGIAALTLTIPDTPIQGNGTLLNISSGLYKGELHYEDFEDLTNTKYHLQCESDRDLFRLSFIKYGEIGVKLWFEGIVHSQPIKASGIMEFV